MRRPPAEHRKTDGRWVWICRLCHRKECESRFDRSINAVTWHVSHQHGQFGFQHLGPE